MSWGKCLCLVMLVSDLSSCTGNAASGVDLPGDPAANPRRSDNGVPVTPAFDVSAVMRRVRFAFRPERDAYEGGDSSYAVRVQGGRVSITPYRDPMGVPARDRSASTPSGLRVPDEPLAERRQGSPLRLETSFIGRGQESIASGTPEMSVGTDGQLSIARGAVTEMLKNQEGGLEQSWRFAERPSGAGDLVVRIAAEAQALRAENGTGLHFAGGAGGIGMRYGHATWVDAKGTATVVPARWVAEAIELRVPVQVVEASAYPAVLDPLVNPEVDLDEPVFSPGNTPFIEDTPEISGNGSGVSLFVWQAGYDIFATRVNASGSVLDPAGIRVSTGPLVEFNPGVDFDGTNWLVVWQDFRSGTNHDVYAARVDANGNVLDPTGIAVSTRATNESNPAVSHNASNWLVTWDDLRGATPDIYAARISAAGVLVDPNGIAVTTAAGVQSMSDVAYNGTHWLVTWQDGSSNTNISAVRVSDAGEVIDTSPIAVTTASNGQTAPSVASAGTQWLVVWQDAQNGGPSTDVYGARVSATGLVSSVTISTAANVQATPRVGYDGTNWLVTWADRRNNVALSDIYAARVDTSGTVLDANGISVAAVPDLIEFDPVLAYNGINWQLAWLEVVSGSNVESRGVRMSTTGAVLDASPFGLATLPNVQEGPALAYNGTDWLAVWSDYRSDYDIYGVRLDATGRVLDPSAIPIATSAGDQRAPSVGSNGTDWLVAWDHYTFEVGDIYAARVSAAGSVLDPDGIAISAALGESETSSAVSSDGTNWLVAYTNTSTVKVTRLSAAGDVLDPGGIAVSSGASASAPTVSFNGTDWLATWVDSSMDMSPMFPPMPTTTYFVHGSRISSDGTVRDPSGIAIASSPLPLWTAHNAADGRDWLVAWSDLRSGLDYDIYGARVGADGVVLDAGGIALSTESGNQEFPKVAYYDPSWLVTWQDKRASGDGDVFAARVNTDGTLLDTAGFVVSNGSAAEITPAAAAGPPGSVLVLYTSKVSLEQRVKGRLVLPDCTPIAGTDTTCDGVDDNCNGIVDEDFVGSPTSCGIGPCAAAGVSSCAGGTVQDSCVAGAPLAATDTTCDGVDDDCSGVADEDYVPEATSCGTGACAAAGITSCAGGTVQDSCVAGAPLAATDTTCDGVDDDCSGVADEDYVLATTSCGTGACAASGTTSCLDGEEHDDCAVDLTDSDGDGVFDCADGCPSEAASTSDGCPEPIAAPAGTGGTGGTGGMGGTGGTPSEPSAGSGGTGAAPSEASAGSGGTTLTFGPEDGVLHSSERVPQQFAIGQQSTGGGSCSLQWGGTSLHPAWILALLASSRLRRRRAGA